MLDKYAIKITDFYDTRGEGTDAYSYYHISDSDQEDNKILLFDSELEASEYINNNKVISHHSHVEAVIYSEMILNKEELIDFIGKVNDQLVLQDIVKDFCKSINLDIEINYKYAIYVYYARHLNKQNHLYTKNNNVVLFDTFDKAHSNCGFFETDDSWAEVEVYQRIIKYGNTTKVFDIY